MNNEVAERIEYFLSGQPVGRSTQGVSGIGVASSRGPREDNQDRAIVANVSLQTGDKFLVGLVCDGMGGMTQGAEAAGCAASVFINALISTDGRSIKEVLFNAIKSANGEVYRRYHGEGGTTLTALVVVNFETYWVVHVGDSRLYQHSDGRGITLLTKDDTIGGQIHRIADEDTLDNRLIQFVGIGRELDPHVFQVLDVSNTRFILTSDGAHSIGRKALEGIAHNSSSPAELVRKIIYVAEAIGVEDNASAVVISIDDLEMMPPFGRGTELTIWNARDKLEMWLESNSDLPSSNSSIANRQDKYPVKKLYKKTPKVRSKSAKRLGTEQTTRSSDPQKPQLHIEFGRRDEENS